MSVVIIGTYTSFIHYLPVIRDKVDRVVVMGQPIGDDSRTPGRESFNCRYDLAACELAMPALAGLHSYFEDIPRYSDCHDMSRPPSHCYVPSEAMVRHLSRKGLAGRLRKALLNDINCTGLYTTPETQCRACTSRSTWEPGAVAAGPGGEMLLWDQTAALFLLRPRSFSLYYPEDHPELGVLSTEVGNGARRSLTW